MCNIPLLTAQDIECRVQSCVKSGTGAGAILLLYKDARVDMRILDEVFGPYGWQRSHELINGNLFCTIEIWDEKKGVWIKKQDVGTESNTEKEKGQASDSFKRAGFNVGIGRELYTAPFIWVALNEGEYAAEGGKPKMKSSVKFSVKDIGYNERREIISLTIIDNKGVERYKMGAQPKSTKKAENPAKKAEEPKISYVCADCGGEIKPLNKAGKPMDIGTYIKGSLNAFGVPVCVECACKRKAAKA